MSMLYIVFLQCTVITYYDIYADVINNMVDELKVKSITKNADGCRTIITEYNRQIVISLSTSRLDTIFAEKGNMTGYWKENRRFYNGQKITILN